MDYFAHETAVIDDNCNIGKGTKIWHFSHIMSNCTMGENCNIGVTCDDDVFLGPSMVFTNIVNPRSAVVRKGEYSRTHVGKGASIGANATIVCGHDIGKFAFIGAGAVVTKTVKDYALVVGNPAKHVGWMSEFGHRLNFDNNNIAVCPESNDKYKLEGDIVIKLK